MVIFLCATLQCLNTLSFLILTVLTDPQRVLLHLPLPPLHFLPSTRSHPQTVEGPSLGWRSGGQSFAPGILGRGWWQQRKDQRMCLPVKEKNKSGIWCKLNILIIVALQQEILRERERVRDCICIFIRHSRLRDFSHYITLKFLCSCSYLLKLSHWKVLIRAKC